MIQFNKLKSILSIPHHHHHHHHQFSGLLSKLATDQKAIVLNGKTKWPTNDQTIVERYFLVDDLLNCNHS